MLINSTLLLDSNIRNSLCTPAKLPCHRVVEGNLIIIICSPISRRFCLTKGGVLVMILILTLGAVSASRHLECKV
jgi:hypothetical protein